jgi:hypothetical protein
VTLSVDSCIPMVTSITGSIRALSVKARASSSRSQETFMRAPGNKIVAMERGVTSMGNLVMFTSENLSKESVPAAEGIFTRQRARSTTESGATTSVRARAPY